MSPRFLKAFTRIFSFSDLFKYKFFFRIGSSIENSTFFSIFISLLVLTPLLAYFFLIAGNTMKHTSAKINVQEFDVNQRPYLHMDASNFRMAFRIILSNHSGFSANINDYFDFSLIYTKARQNNSEFQLDSIKMFSVETCKKENFSQDFQEYYTLNLLKAFCINNHSMDIGGYFDEQTIGFLEFGMAHCGSYYNHKTNCKSREIVEKELRDSYFYVYIESQDVDSTDYQSPLKKSMKTYMQGIDFKERKDFNFYMQRVQLDTYDSLYYNTLPNTQYFNKQFSMVQDMKINIDENDVDVIRMHVFSSNKVQNITRTYMTLIEAAAIVGGVSSFVIVLGTMLTFLYNDMKLKVKLVNKLYTFDLREMTKNNIINKKKENIQLFTLDRKKTFFNKSIKKTIFELGKLKIKEKQDSEKEIKVPDEFVENDQNLKGLSSPKAKIKFIKNPSANNENEINSAKNKQDELLQKSIAIELSSEKTPENAKKNIKQDLFDKESKRKFIDSINIVESRNTKQKYQEKEENNLANSKLKFSTWEIILCILLPFALPPKVKQKYKLYEKASEYLMKYINIFYLIRMVDDMQKMKSIIMNNHQLALFNYISKPLISLRCDESEQENYLSNLQSVYKFSNYSGGSQNQEIIEEIVSYYKELKTQGNWSFMDMRLFEYLDENFKQKLKFGSIFSENDKN